MWKLRISITSRVNQWLSKWISGQGAGSQPYSTELLHEGIVSCFMSYSRAAPGVVHELLQELLQELLMICFRSYSWVASIAAPRAIHELLREFLMTCSRHYSWVAPWISHELFQELLMSCFMSYSWAASWAASWMCCPRSYSWAASGVIDELLHEQLNKFFFVLLNELLVAVDESVGRGPGVQEI